MFVNNYCLEIMAKEHTNKEYDYGIEKFDPWNMGKINRVSAPMW